MSAQMPAGENPGSSKPWFRYLWPWLLMLPPLASIGGGVTMIWLATSTPATLVVADYAQIEALTATRFAADSEAARRGLAAEVLIDRTNPNAAAITIRFAERSAAAALQLRLQHATDATLDRTTGAQPVGEEFKARVALGAGSYLLEIEPLDGSWRLAGELRPQATRLALNASAPAGGALR